MIIIEPDEGQVFVEKTKFVVEKLYNNVKI